MTETLLILIGITFLSMMSPGPDMMLLIKNSVGGSRSAALACVVGICTSVMVHVVLAIVGLAAIISTSVVVYSCIKYAGAVYLIYIGWKSIRYARTTSLVTSGEDNSTQVGVAFREGFFCNILNPKFTVYLVSIFSQFIGPDTALFERIVYGSTIVLEGLIVWSLFVFVVQTRLVKVALQNFQVVINRTVGGVLIAFGCYVAIED